MPKYKIRINAICCGCPSSTESLMQTSCGAGHNKLRPLLPPSECNWLWAMAGDKKLTFDTPTRLPELTQNLIRSSHGHSTPSLKISCKSVQLFTRNVADRKTNKETKKSSENNTPSPWGRGNYKRCLFSDVYTQDIATASSNLHLLSREVRQKPGRQMHFGLFWGKQVRKVLWTRECAQQL